MDGIWEAGAIVITAVLTTIGTWWVQRRSAEHDTKAREEERERHATYLAVRAAATLDAFAMNCIDVVADDGHIDADGHRVAETSTPDLVLPQDVDWRSIDAHLMDRIMRLPNEIESDERAISFIASEIAKPPDYDKFFNERKYRWAKIGIKALDIARDLRDRYKLPQPDEDQYDPRGFFMKEFRVEDERRQRAAEAFKELSELMEQKNAE